MAYSFEPTHHINFINSISIHKPTMEGIRNMANDTAKAKKYADKFTFTPTLHSNVKEFEPLHYTSTITAIRNAVSTDPSAKTRQYIDKFTFEPTHHINFI